MFMCRTLMTENMNFSREFTQEVDGKSINFNVTYDPKTHFFAVVEDNVSSYTLSFNPNTRAWKTADGPEPSIPVDRLAHLVQQNFGVFV